VPSPLTAALLVVRSPLHCCALRVLNRGAQADARPAVRTRTSTVKREAVRKVTGAEQNPAVIADNAKALDEGFARLVGSRDASGSTGREGRAYVMRVDKRAKVTYAAATQAVRKVPRRAPKTCNNR
jgi:hypothetical protein